MQSDRMADGSPAGPYSEEDVSVDRQEEFLEAYDVFKNARIELGYALLRCGHAAEKTCLGSWGRHVSIFRISEDEFYIVYSFVSDGAIDAVHTITGPFTEVLSGVAWLGAKLSLDREDAKIWK